MQFTQDAVSKERLIPHNTSYEAVPDTALEGVEVEDLRIEFNRDLSTRNVCLFGLGAAWILGGITAIIGLKYRTAVDGDRYRMVSESMKGSTSEIIPLGLSLGITTINEALGYIHSASQRWSMQREVGGLQFNSNLRLISSSKTSRANSWYANLIYGVCLVLSYASASQIFFASVLGETDDYQIACSPATIVVLGCATLGQAVVATWAYISTQIPTWSSNPLNTVKACRSAGGLRRVTGRSMLGLDQSKVSPGPVHPRRKQKSAWSSNHEVRYVMFFIWGLVPLGMIWSGIIYALVIHHRKGSYGFIQNYNFIPDDTHGTPFIRTSFPSKSASLASLETLLISAFIQSFLTLGLHAAELQVNLNRDESFWRKMTSKSGCHVSSYDSVLAALKNWPTVVLFASKALIHWLYSMSISVTTFAGSQSNSLTMRPAQIAYLTAAVFIFCVFVTWLTTRRPSGPQPSTFGHLQTLANLVDEWHETMYWGDKSGRPVAADFLDGQVRRAGTSGAPLPPIAMNALYA